MIKHNTIQRALVLAAVRRLQNHATADEIYRAVRLEHPNISRATVYRDLNQLSEAGEIRKLGIPGGADRYDHRLNDHYHFKCERCGRVFDVDMEYIENLCERVRDAHGFEYSAYDIVFRGLCPDCQKSPPR